MPSNFPGPFEIEIISSVQGLEHKQRLNTQVQGAWNVGDPASSINLTRRDLTTVDSVTAVTAWVDLMKPFFAGDYSFDSFNVWQYLANTYDRIFISTAQLGVLGTGAGATNLCHQSIFTFRTQAGGTMKIVQNEDTNGSETRDSYASLGASAQAFMDFVVSDQAWMTARDDTFPIAPLNRVGGQNESVFKKRFR